MPQEPVAATYLCQSVIGSGGMGEVMLAVDLNRGQQVALKLVRADRARKLRALRRFNREVRAMARLDHPSVVAVYDYGVHSDDDGVKRPFFVMEFVQGQSLRGFLNSKPTLEQAHPIFDHILSALAYAHARGVVHRDLKPENVLLSERDGELIPRILDFGIARMIDDELFEDVGTFDPDPIAFRILEDMSTIDASFDEENTQAIELRSSISRPDNDEPGSNRITSLNQCVGTPAYLAPEQIRPKRQGVGPSADLYAFGVMLFELCSGHRPFRARTPQELLRLHLSQPVPAIEAQPHIHMPAGLAELIHRLLAKDPHERPFCAADVRRHLRAIFAGRGLPPPPVPSYDALSNSSLGNSQLRRTRRLKSALQPKLGTGLLRFRDPPLVGRDSEQHSIWQRLVGACENRQMHLVVLDGEAGIGKTRLLNWMRERCEELGIARTVNVSCDATQLGFGLRDGLGRLLGTRSLDADAFEQRLRTELERLGLQRQESILRSFLHPKGAAVNRLAPVYTAFDAVLRRFSQERPLLLQLDDIHFTSDDVFELLQTLLESQLIDPYPALIVASLRGEYLFEPSLAAQIDAISLREDVTRITLKPLSREEMVRLAGSMLPLDAATLAHAVERSAGHPLFLVQLLRQWVASDELDADSTGVLSLRVQPASSSSRINEVVERRITSFISSLHRRSRVSSSVIRAMLECFAVVGESISFDMVSAIARREGISQLQIQEVWENALRDGLCYETTTEDCVQFTHPLVRSQLIEWARAQASYARRHLLCASAKLERGVGDPAQLHLELSEHLFEAGQATRAWRHLVYSARFALDMNRYRVARLRLRRALALLPTLPNEEEQPISSSERFDARRAYIDASLRLSLQEDVGEELLALLHDAGQESERIAWVRLFESEWASSSDHSERAIQGFNEALQRFSATDNDYACTRALLGLGVAKTRSGQLSAGITLLEQAETLARSNANHNLLADALLAKAQALFDSGEQRRALQALDEALVLYQRQANTSGIGDTHMRLARCHLSSNHLELAQSHFESARAAYNLVGDRARLVRILTGLGELARARRAFERAELLYAQALELLAGRERDESAWVLQANLGLVQLQRGALDEARQSLALARDEFARLGSHLYEAIVLGLLASLECAKGDFDAAHRWLTANELLALEKAPADRDYAFTLKDAAEKAFRHAQVPLASRMLKLSLQSLRLLSEHQAAEAVQRRIEQFVEIQKRTSS